MGINVGERGINVERKIKTSSEQKAKLLNSSLSIFVIFRIFLVTLYEIKNFHSL